MKLKYRIKKITFPTAVPFWVAQYKVLRMWINISSLQKGRFFKTNTTRCELYESAVDLILVHKRNMKRAGEHSYKKESVIGYH